MFQDRGMSGQRVVSNLRAEMYGPVYLHIKMETLLVFPFRMVHIYTTGRRDPGHPVKLISDHDWLRVHVHVHFPRSRVESRCVCGVNKGSNWIRYVGRVFTWDRSFHPSTRAPSTPSVAVPIYRTIKDKRERNKLSVVANLRHKITWLRNKQRERVREKNAIPWHHRTGYAKLLLRVPKCIVYVCARYILYEISCEI